MFLPASGGLEETVKLIENKESGRQAKKTVGVTNSRQVGKVQTATQTKGNPCSHWCRRTHGSSLPERETSCSAYTQTCDKCSTIGYFKTVCRSKIPADATEVKVEDSETNQISIGSLAGLMFTMASVTREVQRMGMPKVPPMLYEQIQRVKKVPPKHP